MRERYRFRRVARATVLSGLCLLLAAQATAEGAHVDKATAEQKQQAQSAYMDAMEKFERGAYDQALAGFRRSYDIVRSPNSRFMIARSLARMGRNVEAYEELELVIEEVHELGDRYEDTALAAYSKQEDIRPRIGLVTVKVSDMPKGTKVYVDDRELEKDQIGKSVPVLPGKVRVTAKTPQGQSVERTIKVTAASMEEVELELEKEKPGDRKPKREPFYIERPGNHPEYLIELEAHGLVSTLEPPGPANGGAGLGGRVTVELFERGVLSGINDSIGVGAGADWVATSVDPHVWIPVVGQWNFWVIERVSVFAEPGVAFMVGAGEFIRPSLSLGGRFRIVGPLTVTVRAGLPVATLGASLLL